MGSRQGTSGSGLVPHRGRPFLLIRAGSRMLGGPRRVGWEPQEEPGWRTDKILSSSLETIWGESCTWGPGRERLLRAAAPPEEGAVLAGAPVPFPARPTPGQPRSPPC